MHTKFRMQIYTVINAGGKQKKRVRYLTVFSTLFVFLNPNIIYIHIQIFSQWKKKKKSISKSHIHSILDIYIYFVSRTLGRPPPKICMYSRLLAKEWPFIALYLRYLKVKKIVFFCLFFFCLRFVRLVFEKRVLLSLNKRQWSLNNKLYLFFYSLLRSLSKTKKKYLKKMKKRFELSLIIWWIGFTLENILSMLKLKISFMLITVSPMRGLSTNQIHLVYLKYRTKKRETMIFFFWFLEKRDKRLKIHHTRIKEKGKWFYFTHREQKEQPKTKKKIY